MLGVGLALTGVRGVGPGSPANRMLAREAQGLALSFVDDFLLSTTSHYGSARVKDTSTPANNYNSHPFGLLTYSSPSVKLCRGPDGNLRYGAHNFTRAMNAIPTSPTGGGDHWRGSGTNDGKSMSATDGPTITVDQQFRNLSVFMGGATSGQKFKFKAEVFVISGNTNLHITVATGSTLMKAIACPQGQWTPVEYEFEVSSTSFTVGVQDRNSSGFGQFKVRKYQLFRTPADETYLQNDTTSPIYELPYEWDENGDLLGIRVEEQRTNSYLSSNDLSNTTYWRQDDLGGVTEHSSLGAVKFWAMTDTAINADHVLTAQIGNRPTSSSAGQKFAFSTYLKAGTWQYAHVAVVASTHFIGCVVDTTNWTITDSGAGANDTLDSATIENIGNNVYRVTLIGSWDNEAQSIIPVLGFSSSATFNGGNPAAYSGSGDTVIFGLTQVEIGATFATSPIETAGSTVTRAADNISLATSKFPYNQSAGTLYASGIPLDASANRTIANICDSGSQGSVERFEVRIDSSSQLSAIIVSEGIASVSLNSGVVATGQLHKIALAATTSEATAYGNGSSLGTDTSVTMPSPAELRIGRQGSVSPFFGHIQEIMYLPRRMSNTELQEITS